MIAGTVNIDIKDHVTEPVLVCRNIIHLARDSIIILPVECHQFHLSRAVIIPEQFRQKQQGNHTRGVVDGARGSFFRIDMCSDYNPVSIVRSLYRNNVITPAWNPL